MVSRRGHRALVVNGLFDQSSKFAHELAYELSRGPGDIKSDALYAVNSMAEEGTLGAATLACVDIVTLRQKTFLEVCALGDCEVAIFRQRQENLERPDGEWVRVFGSGGATGWMSGAETTGESESESEAGDEAGDEATPQFHPMAIAGGSFLSVTSDGVFATPRFARNMLPVRVLVQAHDAVVIGSYGLFRSLGEGQIEAIIAEAVGDGYDDNAGQRLSRMLVREAKKAAVQSFDISAIAGLVRL